MKRTFRLVSIMLVGALVPAVHSAAGPSQDIDFIEERTGQMPDWDDLLFMVNDHGGSGVGLGALSDAVMSEVVSLHIHLENVAKRPEILKSYLEKGIRGAGGER
jgi:hypothetical protein